jgi:hypothetical protein
MKSIGLILVGSLVVLSGCSPQKAEQPPVAVAPNYAPTSTIKDIMDSIVDPNADYLWGTVSATVTSKGTITKVPKTDDDWKEVRRHAVSLFEATNLLIMPNRHVARPGEKSDNPDIEEAPEAIEAHIHQDPATFANRIEALRDASASMLAAIDKKDPVALESSGDILDRACESCHLVYWYPKDEVGRKIFEGSSSLQEKK